MHAKVKRLGAGRGRRAWAVPLLRAIVAADATQDPLLPLLILDSMV